MWDPADDKEIAVTVDVLGNGFDNARTYDRLQVCGTGK